MTTGWKFYRVGTRFIEKADPRRCRECGETKSFCYQHDAYYCKPCDIWLESSCGRCDDCWDRPRRPSGIIWRRE